MSDAEELVKNNIMQYFNPDGMAEKTIERGNKILADIMDVIKKHDVPITMTRGLTTESQIDKETGIPLLFFTGEKLALNIVVPPEDKFGNTGKRWLKKDEYNSLKEKIISEGMQELIVHEEDDEITNKESMS